MGLSTYKSSSLEAADPLPLAFVHFPQLDGLRGIAVLLVVLGHWLEYSGAPFGEIGGHAAKLGVLLFFVLSGFLITGLLLLETKRNSKLDLRAFYIRRLLRLGPAFLLFFIAVIILAKLKLIIDIPGYEFAVCLLYLRNIFGRSLSLGHLWSLSLEEQFYMLWPLAVKLVPVKHLFAFAVIVSAVVASARTLGIALHWAPYESGVFYLRPWFRFDSILAGCCLMLALLAGNELSYKLGYIVRAVPPMGLWGVLLAWTFLGEQLTHSLYITIQVLLTSITVAQLVILSQTHSILVNAPVRFLGKISYSLYLWHVMFLVINKPCWGLFRKFPFSFVVSVAVAASSYYVVERPALKLKRRWVK